MAKRISKDEDFSVHVVIAGDLRVALNKYLDDLDVKVTISSLISRAIEMYLLSKGYTVEDAKPIDGLKRFVVPVEEETLERYYQTEFSSGPNMKMEEVIAWAFKKFVNGLAEAN